MKKVNRELDQERRASCSLLESASFWVPIFRLDSQQPASKSKLAQRAQEEKQDDDEKHLGDNPANKLAPLC